MRNTISDLDFEVCVRTCLCHNVADRTKAGYEPKAVTVALWRDHGATSMPPMMVNSCARKAGAASLIYPTSLRWRELCADLGEPLQDKS